MLAVYTFAWRAIRRGARPEPWQTLALSVFSMTCLFRAGRSTFISTCSMSSRRCARRPAALVTSRWVLQLLTVILILVTSAAAMVIGAAAPLSQRYRCASISAPDRRRRSSRAAFARDSLEDGPRTYRVVDEVVTVRVSRASRLNATIRLVAGRRYSVPAQVPAWPHAQRPLSGHKVVKRPNGVNCVSMCPGRPGSSGRNGSRRSVFVEARCARSSDHPERSKAGQCGPLPWTRCAVGEP